MSLAKCHRCSTPYGAAPALAGKAIVCRVCGAENDGAGGVVKSAKRAGSPPMLTISTDAAPPQSKAEPTPATAKAPAPDVVSQRDAARAAAAARRASRVRWSKSKRFAGVASTVLGVAVLSFAAIMMVPATSSTNASKSPEARTIEGAHALAKPDVASRSGAAPVDDVGARPTEPALADRSTQSSKATALPPIPGGDPAPVPGSGSTSQPATPTQQPAPASDGNERGDGKENAKPHEVSTGSSPPRPAPGSRRSHRVSSGAVDGVDELQGLSTHLAMLRSLPQKGTRQLDESWGAPKLDVAELAKTLWEVRELDWRLKEAADGLRGAAKLNAGGFIRGDTKSVVLLRDPVSPDESLTQAWEQFLVEWVSTREQLLGWERLGPNEEKTLKAEIERSTRTLKTESGDKVSLDKLADWMEFFILPSTRTGVTEQRMLIDAERVRAAEEAKRKQEREERERRAKRERQGEEQ